jgi:hypothetical protein
LRSQRAAPYSGESGRTTTLCSSSWVWPNDCRGHESSFEGTRKLTSAASPPLGAPNVEYAGCLQARDRAVTASCRFKSQPGDIAVRRYARLPVETPAYDSWQSIQEGKTPLRLEWCEGRRRRAGRPRLLGWPASTLSLLLSHHMLVILSRASRVPLLHQLHHNESGSEPAGIAFACARHTRRSALRRAQAYIGEAPAEVKAVVSPHVGPLRALRESLRVRSLLPVSLLVSARECQQQIDAAQADLTSAHGYRLLGPFRTLQFSQ